MIVKSTFEPARWLASPHLQTLWPHLFRRTRIERRRERLELPDGDFIDLDWVDSNGAWPRPGPTVIVFHGLGGCSRSHYAAGILKALANVGFRAVLMHFRGCGGEPNRLTRGYHAGDTGDIQFIIEQLAHRFPDRPVIAIGYSLGGNALLKYLGESGENTPLAAAVAVSVPFDLAAAGDRLDSDGSGLYRRYLLHRMRQSARLKLRYPDYPVDARTLAGLKTFRGFDDRITAPLHGFVDVDDYYARASSRPYLKYIQKPTLILHARDDPFMSPAGIPRAEELSSAVILELSETGGHVGFIDGQIPGRTRSWLDRRIVDWLLAQKQWDQGPGTSEWTKASPPTDRS